MRRTFFVAVTIGWSAIAAIAACSSFSSDDATTSDAGGEGGEGGEIGDEGPVGADGAVADAADSGVKPLAVCPLVPAAPPCTTACEEQLLPLPVPMPAGAVVDARIAVHGDTIYVARVVVGTRVELFSNDQSAAGWTLRGTFQAAKVFGLAVNDTTIVVSLQNEAPDGAATGQQIAVLDVGCDASCVGAMIAVPGSTAAGPGVVSLGKDFYLSASNGVELLKDGVTTSVSSEFGGPVVAADCTYVYFSNVFDHAVHRYDPALKTQSPIASEVGIFDASAFDGSYPGTVGLAAANGMVYATTGSAQVYAMPNDPVHTAEIIVHDVGVSSVIVADNRYVYYEESRGLGVSAIVRVQPDGGDHQTISSVQSSIVDMASDADHLYVVGSTGQVTRLKK